jgi:ankyrin repeat protein
MAVSFGHEECIKMLLDSGANINKADKDGVTPLYIAVEKNRPRIVELLVDVGADINKPTKDGSTPLYVAVEKVRVQIVRLLLDSGADPSKDNDIGWTPLYLAEQKGNDKIIKLIKANINKTKAKFGKKPQKRPSSAVCTRAQKLGVRLTLKRNNKRVYKSEEMLRKQIKNAVTKRKQQKQKQKK